MSVDLTIAHGSYPLIHADSIAQDLGLILCPAQDMARARSCAWFWHRIKYAQDLGIATSCAWHRIEHAQDVAMSTSCAEHRIVHTRSTSCAAALPHPVRTLCPHRMQRQILCGCFTVWGVLCARLKRCVVTQGGNNAGGTCPDPVRKILCRTESCAT